MGSLLWREVEQGPVLVALEEFIEAFPEPGHGHRVGLADARENKQYRVNETQALDVKPDRLADLTDSLLP